MNHAGSHDPALVALSILIATLASYTALDLASRTRGSKGWRCRAWLTSAAFVMGGGIWSMHFVGMLAFSMPGTEVTYDLGLTALSLVLPIVVTALGFLAASRREAGSVRLGLSGLGIGLAVVGMHYTGMAAMRMPADLRYNHLWVAASILIAVGASTVAVWLAFKKTGFLERLVASIAMGLAVPGMHYAAMLGSTFMAHPAVDQGAGFASLGQTKLAIWVSATTFLILVLALTAAMIDRQVSQAAAREAHALRLSEQRFRLLVQSVTDYAIFMLDPEGHVTNWNVGAERIKGYEASEIIGHHFSHFYTEEDQDAGVPATALETALRDGKFEAEGWRVRKDGTRFWASAVIDPVKDDAGRIIGFAKITRDITERTKTQEALHKAQQALAQAQKMEAVGQLTGGVAHDFNNLLMAVLGSLELLRKRLPNDPKLLRLVDNAVTGAQRGAALTQRMLAFARRQDLKPEPVDIPNLVRGMTDLLSRSLGPTVRIDTCFPLGLPPALVDGNQLELALLNLAVNARDAMPNGGAITIEAGEVDAQDLSEGGLVQSGYVCLAVSDIGTGMDAITLAKAQEPFFTTKGVGKGTGLGLSMVQGLAEQSKGRLVLMSESGVGTRAEIWLPVAEQIADSQEKAEKRSSAPLIESLTVLVVDDDALVLENTAAMLEDLGHRVHEARSGEEALEIVSRVEGLDLVISDQAMPGMTGAELLERLRQMRPELSIILATGYAELPAGTAAGVVKLSKPFDQRALATGIHSALHVPKPVSKVVAFPSKRRS